MLKKIFFLFVLLAVSVTVFSQDIPPKSNTLVTDYTNTLDANSKQELENKLVAYDDTSSTQIAIVLMHSVGDNDIQGYGVKLGRAWGIGQKSKNNGILILAAMDQHKVTIQVAYGLEGALPDATASQIIENDIKPNFRSNNYYEGLNTAVDDIIKYTHGEYKADQKAANNDGSSGGGGAAVIIIIVIVVLIIIFRNRGGGGQIYGGRGGASPFWWFLAGDILGSSGRGGGWGGGSGGGFGGGGGGGGFGGFGGGSFGGGGASGSW